MMAVIIVRCPTGVRPPGCGNAWECVILVSAEHVRRWIFPLGRSVPVPGPAACQARVRPLSRPLLTNGRAPCHLLPMVTQSAVCGAWNLREESDILI